MNKKIVQTLGHSTSRFNEPFLDEVCPFRVFDIASASTGSLRECRFLDNELIFWTAICLICALG